MATPAPKHQYDRVGVGRDPCTRTSCTEFWEQPLPAQLSQSFKLLPQSPKLPSFLPVCASPPALSCGSSQSLDKKAGPSTAVSALHQ